MYNKLKSKINNKLNNQHLNQTFKFINNYTGEISNYPLLENIYLILFIPHNKEFSKLTYILGWRKLK